MENKKKRLIILSVIAGVLVFLMLLSSAIFRIKGVSVEYQTTLTMLSKEDLNLMIENSGIPVGKNIFFASLDDSIKQMERENPYIKINGIERKFPNSLVVLVSERVPVVRIEQNGYTYVLDSDLKILNIVKDGADGDYNAKTREKDLPIMTLSSEFSIVCSGLSVGDFIVNERVQYFVDSFYRGAVTSSREDASVAISLISIIERIDVSYARELERVRFDVTYKDNASLKTKIIGDTNLVDNIYKVIATVNYDITHDEVAYEEVNCTNGVLYAKEKSGGTP